MDRLAERQSLTMALTAIAGGDRAAFQRLYQQTSAKLYGVCLRILHDPGEAEDVLQEVYLTVWNRAGVFDTARGVSPITWLAILARNRAIDRLRASKAHLDRPIEHAEAVADPASSPAQNAEIAETSRRLAACLEELKPEHAAYVRAAFFDGHTYASLATSTGVPLGTMKVWMRRAFLRLRSCLER